MASYRTDYCGELSLEQVGETVKVCGWIKKRRDLGGVIFVDLRDRSGVAQVVFDPGKQDLLDKAKDLRSEFVLGVEGKVCRRPQDAENPNLPTGKIEILAEKLEIYNQAKTPPFQIAEDQQVEENLRMKYRYLDLRRTDRLEILKLRHQVAKAVRDYLDREGFWEIETPVMTKSTPEGARDYLVPSRVNRGKFYALAQSPQLFKQILMVAGLDKYFQIVRCFRDEDLRADRQPEFTQIDLEMSFVKRDELFTLIENMLKLVFEKCFHQELALPFSRMTYREAMDRFGSDKPDLRYGMELTDLTGFFAETTFNILKQVVDGGGKIKGIVLSGKDNLSRKERDELIEAFKKVGGKGLVFLSQAEGEIKSPLKDHLRPEILNALLEKSGFQPGDLLMLGADQEKRLNESLGKFRVELARRFLNLPKDQFKFLWVIDFPLFKFDEEENRIDAEHHAFTSPLDEDLQYMDSEPLKVRANSYDMVLNGYELASGSIRIHQRELQEKVFKILGIGPEEARAKFGFLLEAFEYGAPPHGGIALGFDRMIAILAGEDSIREVIAFPKNLSAICPLTEAPVTVGNEQLKVLGLECIE